MYADISELDEKAQYIRVAWNKMINYASTFTRTFLEIEEEFKLGKFGPEWTFARWLGVKCGMSHATTYRMIDQLHRVASEDQRDKTKKALEQERITKLQLEAERKATQFAWNKWLDDEKQRITDTQAAWDIWLLDEKQRITETQAAWNEWLDEEKERLAKEKEDEAAKKKKEKSRERDRKYRHRKKVEKENEIKELKRATLSEAKNSKNAKAVSNVRLEKAINNLVTALKDLPRDDKIRWVEQITTRLTELLVEPIQEKSQNGHDSENVSTFAARS